MELTPYTKDMLLLISILYFGMRIVFKERGGYGLIIPSLIVVASSISLFILHPCQNAIIGVILVIMSLSVRYMYNDDRDNDYIDVEVV